MWKPVEVTMASVDAISTGVTIVAVESGHLAAYALDGELWCCKGLKAEGFCAHSGSSLQIKVVCTRGGRRFSVN